MIRLATSNHGHRSTPTLILDFRLRVAPGSSFVFLRSFWGEENANSLIQAIPSFGLPLDQVCNNVHVSA